MCAADASSREHSPPRCLFPEAKDLPGRDLRRNLITVPSCPEHNTKTSKDDEYFLVVITSLCQGNQVSTGQFSTKAIRALKRSPVFREHIFADRSPVAVDGAPSMSYRVDGLRIERVVDKISRAVFYDHTKGDKLLDPIQVILPAFKRSDPRQNAAFDNVGTLAQRLFATAAWDGSNQDVFAYRLRIDSSRRASVLWLRFYGGVSTFTVWGSEFQRAPK